MIVLESTAQTIEIVLTGSDGSLHYSFAWHDTTSSSATPGSDEGVLTTIGTYSAVPAPAAGARRLIKQASFINRDPAPCTVRIQKDESASNFALHSDVTLRENDGLHYEDGGRGWYVVRSGEDGTYSGRSVAFFKVGTAADAVGFFYCHSKDSGVPGAGSPGTPSLNGRVTDGTSVADAGCLVIPNAASGGNFLTSFELAATVAQFYSLVDVLWCNSGAVVTTTTAQAITSPTLPARDANGTTNGEGCMIGLLFTAAATNAANIANSTVTYTNSDGTAGRTATLANLVGAQIPATPTIGTIVWFQLQAGDKGVRSIQSLTLGTSLVTGSVSLLIARQLATYSAVVANVGSGPQQPMDPGIRLFNGTCALLCYQAASVTATTVTGSITVQERAL
jgi:hypothetical protein